MRSQYAIRMRLSFRPMTQADPTPWQRLDTPAPPPPALIFMIPRLARGGMLSVLETAWPHLSAHPIVVITQEHSTASVPHQTVRVRRALGDPLRFPGSWVYAARMARAASRIVAAHGGHAVLVPQDSLATGFAAVLAGYRTRTPVIVMDHGSAIAIRTPFFWRERLSRSRLSERIREPMLRASLRLMYRLTCRLASRFLLPSAEAVDRFRADGVPERRMARYHVPVDVQRFRPSDPEDRARSRERLGVPSDRVVAVAVSRLTPEKGLDLLVEAVARLPPAMRPTLVIGGVGPANDAITRLAARLDVELQMVGEVPGHELPNLLGAADLFAYASRQGTNIPVAILEAMACGLLVIATAQPPAAYELLADGRGIVVPAGEVGAYAEALGTAVSMGEGARRAAGEGARRWVEVEHSPDRIATELTDAFSLRTARGP
jgi:glycosyltransferase involved in cell wall biosynthesis